MSIRRVSDLPSVTKEMMEDDKKERFLNSFMEISYLTDPDNEYHNYESKKIKTSDIISAVGDVVLSSPVISGDVYINTSLDPKIPDKYTIDIRAANISVLSQTPTYLNSLSTDEISVKRLHLLNEYDVELSSIDNYDGVNFKLLKKYVQEEIGKLRSSQVPILSFIFSDHKIDSDEWQLAGSEVNIDKYPTLSSEILDGDGNLKSIYRQQHGEDGDMWYYKLEGNMLTLPNADCFFRGVGQGQDADIEMGKIQWSHAPNISGSVLSKNVPQGETEPLTYSDEVDSKGALTMTNKQYSDDYYGIKRTAVTEGTAYRGMSINARRVSTVYQDGVKDIIPDSIYVYVYFYVGPKESQ